MIISAGGIPGSRGENWRGGGGRGRHLIHRGGSFLSVGPQAIAKYLTYFAFSRIGEAGGRAARDGVGGPLTFFL